MASRWWRAAAEAEEAERLLMDVEERRQREVERAEAVQERRQRHVKAVERAVEAEERWAMQTEEWWRRSFDVEEAAELRKAKEAAVRRKAKENMEKKRRAAAEEEAEAEAEAGAVVKEELMTDLDFLMDGWRL